MENKMNTHLEEFFCALVGFFAYGFSHTFGIKLLDVGMAGVGYDLGNKFINLIFGVVTACLAYIAVYFIKKYITKEAK